MAAVSALVMLVAPAVGVGRCLQCTSLSSSSLPHRRPHLSFYNRFLIQLSTIIWLNFRTRGQKFKDKLGIFGLTIKATQFGGESCYDTCRTHISSSSSSYNSNTFVNNNMLSLSAAARLLYVKHLQHCLTPNMSDCYCLIFLKLFIRLHMYTHL